MRMLDAAGMICTPKTFPANARMKVNRGVVVPRTVLLSTLGNFSVTGVSGADEDVVQFTPTALGGTTSGTYAMYLDLSALGISTSEDVGSVELKE